MEQTTHLVAFCLSGSSVALSILPAGSQSPHYRAAGSAGPGARTAPLCHQAVVSAVLKHNIRKVACTQTEFTQRNKKLQILVNTNITSSESEVTTLCQPPYISIYFVLLGLYLIPNLYIRCIRLNYWLEKHVVVNVQMYKLKIRPYL